MGGGVDRGGNGGNEMVGVGWVKVMMGKDEKFSVDKVG